MKARYVFLAGSGRVAAAGMSFRRELWLGVEIESDEPVDLTRFSLEHGYDLIPIDGMAPDVVASVGVHHFERLEIQEG